MMNRFARIVLPLANCLLFLAASGIASSQAHSKENNCPTPETSEDFWPDPNCEGRGPIYLTDEYGTNHKYICRCVNSANPDAIGWYRVGEKYPLSTTDSSVYVYDEPTAEKIRIMRNASGQTSEFGSNIAELAFF